MKRETMTLGGDPEFFVEKADGKLLEAFTFLPSKYEPAKTEGEQSIYWDGAQLEFQLEPNIDINKILDSIRLGLKAGMEFARIKSPGAYISTKTCIEIPLEELAKWAPEHAEFGCVGSLSAYNLGGPGADGRITTTRSCGGHIHMACGRKEPKIETLLSIVKTLDSILGVVGVSLFEHLDSPKRRTLYGKVGEFRTPLYSGGKIFGLEWRVLSNSWLFHPQLAGTILDLARKTVHYSQSKNYHWVADQAAVIETVLLSDIAQAREMIKANYHCFKEMGFNPGNIDLLAPIENSLPMKSIEQNWNL